MAPIDYGAMLDVEQDPWFDPDEDQTSPRSGLDMPLVIVPPDGWMMDPDDPDRMIDRGCATPDDMAEIGPYPRADVSGDV